MVKHFHTEEIAENSIDVLIANSYCKNVLLVWPGTTEVEGVIGLISTIVDQGQVSLKLKIYSQT